MNQLRNLRFNALAILIVFAVLDIIIAFEAGRIHERRKMESEPRVYFKVIEAPVLLRLGASESL